MGCADVGDQQTISPFGKNSITVRAVLASGYVNTVPGMIDITTFEACEFADPDAGRV